MFDFIKRKLMLSSPSEAGSDSGAGGQKNESTRLNRAPQIKVHAELATSENHVARLPSESSDKIFFMHIGKTAGTSVNALLKWNYGERFFEHLELLDRWPEKVDNYDCVSGHVQFGVFKRAVKTSTRFRFITVIREPVAQLISHLNWIKLLGSVPEMRKNTSSNILQLSDALLEIDLSDPAKVKKFLNDGGSDTLRISLFDNHQSRYFLGAPFGQHLRSEHFEVVVQAFREFEFIGISEEPESLFNGLKNCLRLQKGASLPALNVQKYNRSVDNVAFKKALWDWLGFDCILYEMAIGQLKRDNKRHLET